MMNISKMDVVTPKSLTECLEILAKNEGDYRLLAGGTKCRGENEG